MVQNIDPGCQLIAGPSGSLEVLLECKRGGQVASQSQQASHLVVLAHPHPQMEGTMFNKVVHSMSRYYQSAELPVVRFNFRGVGNSTGVYDQGIGEIEDFISVAQWAINHTGVQRLIVAGFSFGSYIALAAIDRLLTMGVSIDSGLLVAPPIERMPFASLASIKRSVPLVVVQGEADTVVSPAETYTWTTSVVDPVQLVRIPDAGHFFHKLLTRLKEPVASSVQQAQERAVSG